MFVFRKFWRAWLCWNTRFEIRPLALLPTKCISNVLKLYWIHNYFFFFQIWEKGVAIFLIEAKFIFWISLRGCVQKPKFCVDNSIWQVKFADSIDNLIFLKSLKPKVTQDLFEVRYLYSWIQDINWMYTLFL